jgi:hypothetical protein
METEEGECERYVRVYTGNTHIFVLLCTCGAETGYGTNVVVFCCNLIKLNNKFV